MRCWNVAVVLSLGIASLLFHQGRAQAQFMLQLARSDVTVWPALIGSAVLTGSQDPWFKVGGRTGTDRVPSHYLPALSNVLLIRGEGKRTTPVGSPPCFCAAPFTESFGSTLARGMSLN